MQSRGDGKLRIRPHRRHLVPGLPTSNRILTLVAERRLVPLVTTALFLEYEDVLNRPEQRLATGMAIEDIVGFLAALACASEPVDVHFVWRPQSADPADELEVEAAVNGRASAIVTHNVRDSLPAASDFKIYAELVPRGAGPIAIRYQNLLGLRRLT